MRVEAVDAHGHGVAAPVDVVEGGDDVLSRLPLVRGGDGVLEVEEDHVGRRFRRLLEELRLAAGHGELAAVEARRRLLDDLEAHGLGSFLTVCRYRRTKGRTTEVQRHRGFTEK